MPFQDINPSAVLPVFVLEKWVPDGCTVYDLCFAAEKVTGPGSIDGATCIKGLWRLYPLNEVARIKILTNGITMGSKLIRFEGINPFLQRGSENNGTRMTISNLPFSYGNEAVARNLSAAGLKLRSKITFEKARGPDKMLSDWRTGRRSVWIDLPQREVSKYCKMGDFTATLYYKEMKLHMQCRRCLQKGHMARDCSNQEVCFDCKQPGHRRGHPDCSFSNDESIWGHPNGLAVNVQVDNDSAPRDDLNIAEEELEAEIVEEVSTIVEEVSTVVVEMINSDAVEDKDDNGNVFAESVTTDKATVDLDEGEGILNTSFDSGEPISSINNETFEKQNSGSKNFEEAEIPEEESCSKNASIKADKGAEVKTLKDDCTLSEPGCKEPVLQEGKNISTPKPKRRQRRKLKNQPSIDTFVTGKRQAGDISSPGDGAVCSPEEKSQKTSSK